MVTVHLPWVMAQCWHCSDRPGSFHRRLELCRLMSHGGKAHQQQSCPQCQHAIPAMPWDNNYSTTIITLFTAARTFKQTQCLLLLKEKIILGNIFKWREKDLKELLTRHIKAEAICNSGTVIFKCLDVVQTFHFIFQTCAFPCCDLSKCFQWKALI